MGDIGCILLFFIAGIVAMLIELFLPGAVMGIIGFLAVCGSIIYAFTTGHPVLGAILIGTTIVFIPIFFLLWKNVLGRLFAFKSSEKGFRSSARNYEELMGKEGQAVSPLRPSGTVMIDGKRYTVVTRGEMLEKGTRTKVIDVTGSRVVVKKA